MKSVLDDLRPEPDWKCGKTLIFKASFIKNFFPPGQTVNGKFYWEFLKWMRSKRPAKTSIQVAPHLLGPQSWQKLRLTRRSLCNSSWLLWIRQSSPTSLLTGPHPLWYFPTPEDEIEAQGATDVLPALKRSRPYCRTWWRPWREITARSASDHGNPGGIAVSMLKGTTSKGMGVNRNFGK
jgi:hypothetical protein